MRRRGVRAGRRRFDGLGGEVDEMRNMASALLMLGILVTCNLSAHARGGAGERRPRVEDIDRRTFDAGAGGKLTLAAPIGDVEVAAEETNVVTVEILRRVQADDRGEATRLLANLLVETEQQGRDVTVRLRFRRETPDDERRRVGLRFQVSVPRGYNLDVSTVGSFRIGDLQGGVSVETNGGDISIGRVSGDVVAASSGGRVKIAAADGASKLTTDGGSVSIESAGAVEAETGGGPFKATLARQPRTDSSISTSGGQIELSIGPGVGVELDAAAADGRVSSDYDEAAGHKRNSLRAAIGGGGPRLVLRSAGGSIRVRKPSAEAAGR
ncbi:MAG TPA: DUF4097 family beta strand repeat-containing protein [Pyrinomonadaceae bacterium]